MATIRKPELDIKLAGKNVTVTLRAEVAMSDAEKYLCDQFGVRFVANGYLQEYDEHSPNEPLWTFVPTQFLSKPGPVEWTFTWPQDAFESIVSTEPGDEELLGKVSVQATLRLNTEKSTAITPYPA